MAVEENEAREYGKRLGRYTQKCINKLKPSCGAFFGKLKEGGEGVLSTEKLGEVWAGRTAEERWQGQGRRGGIFSLLQGPEQLL